MTDQLRILQLKTTVIKAIRTFLDERGFQELITPVLGRAFPLEPTLVPFSTTWQHNQEHDVLYLAQSPERALKRYLALGVGDCYALGKTFRNLEGAGSRHRPEFLMLEWYRWQADYRQIMRDTQDLVRFVLQAVNTWEGRPQTGILSYQGQTFDLNLEWPVISLAELVEREWHQSLETLLDDQELIAFAQKRGYQTEDATWEQLFDQLFLNELEHLLPVQPCFMIDFPTRLSPLCRPRADKPYLAERFEVFINRTELGNGNTENCDASRVRQSFEVERHQRLGLAQGGHPPIDEEFIQALTTIAAKQASLAGIGLGVERLLMVMADVTEIGLIEPLVVSNS